MNTNNYEDMSNWELLSRSLFKKFDEISAEFKSSTIPKFKKVVKRTLLLILTILAVSFALIALGAKLEDNQFIVYGKIGLILVSLTLLILAAPIGFAFNGQKYMTFVRSFAIYQFFFTLIIWLTPMPAEFKVLFGLAFASFILAMTNTFSSEMRVVKFFTTVIFCALLVSLYFPGPRHYLYGWLIGVNEPKLLKISKGEIPEGKVRFFLQGRPAVWYFVTPDGKYELFDNDGHHDIYRVKLQPISELIVERLVSNENLLSLRNMRYVWVESSSIPETEIASKSSLPQPELQSESQPESEPVPRPLLAPPRPSEQDSTPKHLSAPPQIETPSSPKHPPAPPPVEKDVEMKAIPEKKPDDRREYAVVVLNQSRHLDHGLGEELTSWLSYERAAYAPRRVVIKLTGNVPDSETRTALAKIARKIVVVEYSTKMERNDGTLKLCSALVTVKVYSSENGELIKEVSKTQSVSDIDTEWASRKALDFAMKAVKNYFKNHL